MKTLEQFLNELGNCESGGYYRAFNKFGYAGKYQMGEMALVDCGYYQKKTRCFTVDYMTLVVGETKDGVEIFSLKNDTDVLLVPVYLEELMKEAIITRTMLNTIASESDENYSAYLKQANRAYKRLVKYSKGLCVDKSVRF